ncbi:uncharacterized protein BP5553_03505 [Venustampulla echinocandica]|uniref:Cytochrome P450 n=1 Tax=Venustampulla echinocandica TaxID=2656787 RepID=A0A370TUF4_9HELO|nr:uncharacterized protein BP5553_03505 [Venustampulla echinocandica]RDL39165.1 hypothetical protein BP5553_03505 [Venustampulla echinocandica]
MLDYLSLIAYGIPILYFGPYLLSYFTTLFASRRFAKTSPIPSVTVYTWRDSILVWLFSPYIAPFFECLPFRLGHWVLYVKRDFSWCTKGDLARKEVGDVYWAVGPGGAQLWVSDADLITQIVHRRNDFVKRVSDYAILNIFGFNVVTTEGALWQRHRKITGPPFNEKNSSLVFDPHRKSPYSYPMLVQQLFGMLTVTPNHEGTHAQGKAMLASFTYDAEGNESPAGQEPVVEDLIHWMMTVTLNVISSASLNINAVWPIHSVAAKNYKFKPPSGHNNSNLVQSNTAGLPFQESFDTVMNNIRILIAFPAWILRNSPFKIMRITQQSSDHFSKYMHELISAHKAKIESGSTDGDSSSAPGDLLSSIVKASTGNKGTGLSEEEMVGNIFVFTLAGHETTATTLQSALILLACEPQVRMEVQKEIDEIWAGKKTGEDLTYDDYGKMRVIMALMLETLRVYPPVVMLPKITTARSSVTYNNQTISIPANSRVLIDVVSVQRNPKYWGPNNHSFVPSRWLMPSSYTPPPDSNNESPAHANLFCPPKGAFIAFNGGFRACLGRKFAQVEFCTLISVLLRGHSVELVREKGKGWEETRAKALVDLDDRRTGVAMRMNKKVRVRFVKRGMESSPLA